MGKIRREPDEPMWKAWEMADHQTFTTKQDAFYAGYRAAQREALRAVEYFVAELLEEAVALGEAHHTVRSVRRSIDEGPANVYTPSILSSPSQTLARMLLRGEGIESVDEDEEGDERTWMHVT